jgi:hypothetical protein
MATGTAGTNARQLPWQVVHFLRKTVNYNDTGIGTADTVKLGTLPSGALILDAQVRVTTAFNAATTNVLTVGTSSGSDADVVSAADVDEATTGSYQATRGRDLTFSADTALYVKYTQSGTAATAGVATVIVAYVTNTDG